MTDNVERAKQGKLDYIRFVGEVLPMPPDNHEETLLRWDAIIAREQQIADDKEAMAKLQERKRKAAIKAGRYNSDGTPTEAELERIKERHEANLVAWFDKTKDCGPFGGERPPVVRDA